jgi:hypothetical protein
MPVRPGSSHPNASQALARRLDAERDALLATLPAALPEPALRRTAALEICRRSFDALLCGETGADIDGDALAAFFERSLVRKPVGAYYTQADVAGYIAGATLVPALLDRAAALQPLIFGPQASAWRGLACYPEHVIHADMRHGADVPLPLRIAAGIADVTRREHWDTLAPRSHALANETWREVLARHDRYHALRAMLAAGHLTTPAALVTHNLDMPQVLATLVQNCDEPDGVLALWHALGELRVLDPTCGAGAFLLAAMRALEPIYHVCLARLALYPSTAARVAEFDRPPGRAGRVRAAIVARNLYAVDLMPEALEVCRMRLALETDGAGEPRAEANLAAGDALLLDWQRAFPHVMAAGGFDAVIGNPPYLVLARGERRTYEQAGYHTAACGNLYALVVERSLALLRPGGRLGMVVPVASVATDGMGRLQERYAPYEQWHSHYAVRPARLFDGVDMNLTISLLHKAPGARHTTGYRRWSGGASGTRDHLFTTLAYTQLPAPAARAAPFPKLVSPLATAVLARMQHHNHVLGDYVARSGTTLFYHSGGRYWRKALPHKLSSHYKPLTLPPALAPIALCLLNSQLFYWYWIAHSNCMDLVSREVLRLPVFALEQADPAPFAALGEQLMAAYARSRRQRVRRGTRIRVEETNFDVSRARPVIDTIDELLAQHYGLDAAALDFVRSYDIKYRAGLLRSAKSNLQHQDTPGG